jgi:hypothetical protein
MDTGLIAGHIAHAAASFGATAPLAIIAIVRQAFDIGTIVTKALLDLDQMGDYIEKELAFLVKHYSGDAEPKSGNNIKETVLGAVKGVLNLEVPSVKVCRTHIDDYQHKLNTLTNSYNELGFSQARVQKSMIAHAATFNAIDGELEPKQKAAYRKLLNGVESAYLDLGKRIAGKDKAMTKGAENIERWEGALSTLEDATAGWTKIVPNLVSLVTGLGLGLGHIGGEQVEGAAEMAERTMKLIIEAVTGLLEGLNILLFDKIPRPIKAPEARVQPSNLRRSPSVRWSRNSRILVERCRPAGCTTWIGTGGG